MNRKSLIREQLRSSALLHILEKGYEKVTMDELAEIGGVSRRTYFRYFETKEDVIVGLISARGEMIANAARARPASETSFEALENALIQVVEESFNFSKAAGHKILKTIWQHPELKSRYYEHKTLWIPLVAKVLVERGETQAKAIILASTGLMILDIALENRSRDPKNSLNTILKKTFCDFREAINLIDQ